MDRYRLEHTANRIDVIYDALSEAGITHHASLRLDLTGRIEQAIRQWEHVRAEQAYKRMLAE